MIDLLHHLGAFLPFLFLGSIFGSDSNSSSSQTSVNSTSQGAQSPSNSGSGIISSATAPVIDARLGSKVIYNYTPADNTDVLAALDALNKTNASLANSGTSQDAVLQQVLASSADQAKNLQAGFQTLASSINSGGQTDFQASLVKIVTIVAVAVAAIFVVPKLFSK